MAAAVNEAVLSLRNICLEDEQPCVQGIGNTIYIDKTSSASAVGCADIAAYNLCLEDDTRGFVVLENLVKEAKTYLSMLYSYRSCVRALPQLPPNQKDRIGELYKATYDIMDKEMGHLRGLQKFQSHCSAKIATDLQSFANLERRLNGPSVAHMWALIRILDVLFLLDFLKDRKSSLSNDFSWYKRTSTQVSQLCGDVNDQKGDNDHLQIFLTSRSAILTTLRTELNKTPGGGEAMLQGVLSFCLDMLEANKFVLFAERHMMIRAIPWLVFLSEKDPNTLFHSKKAKIGRLVRLFENDLVVPGFMEIVICPLSVLKELSPSFKELANDERLPGHNPASMDGQKLHHYQKQYEIVNHVDEIRRAHDDFCIRFSAFVNQLKLLLGATDSRVVSKDFARDGYLLVLEGFRMLSGWTARVLEQAAWKGARPTKATDPHGPETDSEISEYERVVRCNYTEGEKKALVEVLSYIKGAGAMMMRGEVVVVGVVRQGVHSVVQDFVQNEMTPILRNAVRRKKLNASLLEDLRTVAADWKGNTIPDTAMTKRSKKRDERPLEIYLRSTAPSYGQIHAMQYLVGELLSWETASKSTMLFSSERESKPEAADKLHTFFYDLLSYPAVLDYKDTLCVLTDLGSLWFREFYLELSRGIQFPIDCSMPWILVSYVLESEDPTMIENVLLPFDIYNDSANTALRTLKQQFLYDEIEAEVDLCFDQLVFKLSLSMFAHFKALAASQLVDLSFVAATDSVQKLRPPPKRFTALFHQRHLQLLGRNIDLKQLMSERMNKIVRENLDFLIVRQAALDICALVELQGLVRVLELTHKLLSQHLSLDPFPNILTEVFGITTLGTLSNRLVQQVIEEVQRDLFPNLAVCNATQRFVRPPVLPPSNFVRAQMPPLPPGFLYGSPELNWAYSFVTELHSQFFGLPHMRAVLKLIQPQGLPVLIQSCLDTLEKKIMNGLVPHVAQLMAFLPSSLKLPRKPSIPVTEYVGDMSDALEGLTEYPRREDLFQCLREIGSIFVFFSLLDTALRERETEQFMQAAPFLGIIPGRDGQLQQVLMDDEGGPLVLLAQQAVFPAVVDPSCPAPDALRDMLRSTQQAESMYWSSLHGGSVMRHVIGRLDATLASLRHAWSPPGGDTAVDHRTSRPFHLIYSSIQFVFCREMAGGQENWEVYGDAMAWGGAGLVAVLGQHLRFERCDFCYQALLRAEAEASATAALIAIGGDKARRALDRANQPQDVRMLLDNAKKARRLNTYVISLFRANMAEHHTHSSNTPPPIPTPSPGAQTADR